MSKLPLHKKSRHKRRSSESAGLVSSVWQSLSSFATIDPTKPSLKFPTKLVLAFSLPLLAIAAFTLVSHWGMDAAIAQSGGPTPAGAPAATTPPSVNSGDTAWLLASSAMVLFMSPGLAFFYGGLVRSRNVLNMMMMSFVSMGIVGVTWVLWGYSLSFYNPAEYFKDATTFADGIYKFVGGFGWFGLNGVALDPHPIYSATVPHQLFMAYQMMFAMITVSLISGAIAERMSFKAYFWFVLLWSTFVYCPLAHMVWGRGLLGSMGALDFAGGTVVHISSGVSALVAAWLIGPRRDYAVRPIVPHNVPFVLLGVGILWFGWFGFNAGSAIGIGDYKVGASATVAFVATSVAASAGGVAWMVAEWLLKGKPTAVGIGSGFVSGLVGVTPGAGFVTPTSAIVIGALTGLACFAAVNLKSRFQFDDSLDTFPIHGVGGTVGAILTGVFATKLVNGGAANGLLEGNGGLLVTQIVAVLIAYAIAAIGTLIILKVLSLFMSLRVDSETEAEGLDVYEHGETGYGEEIPGEVSFSKSREA